MPVAAPGPRVGGARPGGTASIWRSASGSPPPSCWAAPLCSVRAGPVRSVGSWFPIRTGAGSGPAWRTSPPCVQWSGGTPPACSMTPPAPSAPAPPRRSRVAATTLPMSQSPSAPRVWSLSWARSPRGTGRRAASGTPAWTAWLSSSLRVWVCSAPSTSSSTPS